MKDLSREELLHMLYLMMKIRAFEERVIELFSRAVLPGFLHVAIGQEATSVGTCSTLREDDYIITTHRGHGDLIAKGVGLDGMMAELYARQTGLCRGKGGSMHIADFSKGVVCATGIVGSGLPVANGVALSFQLRQSDQVMVSFFGDGATNTGAFHESLNLAALWDLPVVFVCHNNLYALSTPQHVHQKISDSSLRAVAYGMPGLTIDGNDVLAVRRGVREAVERARKGDGPSLIECKTYRWYGHYIGDPASYRSKEEVERWKKRDPITLFQRRLLEEGITASEEIEQLRCSISAEVDEAVRFAEAGPEPLAQEVFLGLFSEGANTGAEDGGVDSGGADISRSGSNSPA